jgi:DNA polymerase-4/DNA polymerase V
MPHGLLALSAYPNPILHIDCDAFFTSVEEALDPSLKGKPLITGRERGIVACASYAAKALGVRRPMKLSEAMSVCPGLVCLSSDYESYSLFSKRLFSIVRRFTPIVEEYSIDEAYAEIGGLRRLYRMDYPAIAMKIKTTVQTELGITVSVGLGASKTLAKIASKRQKPDGFTPVPADELHHFLKTVKVIDVCGLGPNTCALLNKYGVYTAWDYVSRPEEWTKKTIGKIGAELWRELRGQAVYPFVTQPKEDYASISKCKTFTPPSRDKETVRAQLVRNVESAFIKIRRYRLRASGMLVHLRDQEFKSVAAEARLERGTSSTIEGGELASALFEKAYVPGKLYRQTGVVLFKLDAGTETQYSLFDDVAKIQSLRAVDRVIDRVNEIYGKHALHLATADGVKQHSGERGEVPARRRENIYGENARQRLGLPLWRISV